MAEPNHFRRLMLTWFLASAIATPLVVVLLGPILPPGNGSVQASGRSRSPASCTTAGPASCPLPPCARTDIPTILQVTRSRGVRVPFLLDELEHGRHGPSACALPGRSQERAGEAAAELSSATMHDMISDANLT